MRTFESVLGLGWGIKEKDERDEFNYEILEEIL
jgi:hypothetical protein